jgi:hypothetical protein
MALGIRLQIGLSDLAIAALERMIAGLVARRQRQKDRQTARETEMFLASLAPWAAGDIGVARPCEPGPAPRVFVGTGHIYSALELCAAARGKRRGG